MHSKLTSLIFDLNRCESGQAMTEYVILLGSFMVAFVSIPPLVQAALLRYYQPFALLLSLPIP